MSGPPSSFSVVLIFQFRISCDDANQDWYQSASLLVTAIAEMLAIPAASHIKEIFLQSDGASNFSCTAFMLALPVMLQQALQKPDSDATIPPAQLPVIRGHLITESGGGKSRTDQDFSVVQRQLIEGWQHGDDIEDADDILRVLDKKNSRKYAVNVKVDLDRQGQPTEKPKTNKNQDRFYYREYQYGGDDSENIGELTGIKLFQHFGIGEGKLLTRSDIEGLWSAGLDVLLSTKETSEKSSEPGDDARLSFGPLSNYLADFSRL